MANRNLSPDTSLSLLILRAIAAGIRPCEIYNLPNYGFFGRQQTIEIYRSKGFSLGDIKRIDDAKLSPMQVYYAINKDKAHKNLITELENKLISYNIENFNSQEKLLHFHKIIPHQSYENMLRIMLEGAEEKRLHQKVLEHKKLWSNLQVSHICHDVKMNETISQA